ncbi:DEP domain-containing protein 7 isoform X1 [Patella vulgata]|uniref:DEP domain-containing protein 7 isoform X1 n=1 Tax=Patella vulgata TaxID=6465 RepID=UPI00217F4D2D|nr:DEP domain-containing protein 7 isoform X1 [Patella vulgata]
MAYVGEASPQLSRFTRGTVLRESKVSMGPFRATQIWNEVICHLKTRVELKKRRHKLRQYDNCFTGADAVDVVLHYLLNDRDTFNNDLSREKAAKLCQTLMDKNVFEPAGCRASECKRIFEDSSGKLYKFLQDDKDSLNDDDVCDDLSMYDETDDLGRKDEGMKMAYSEVDLVGDDICNPIAVDRNGHIIPALASIRGLMRSKSISSIYSTSSDKSLREDCLDIPNEVIEEIWKETALAQLLTLVDVSFVDGPLSEEKPAKKPRHNLIISNTIAKRYTSPYKGSAPVFEDSVLHAGYDCIECLPKGLNLLSDDCLRQSNPKAKNKVFNIIAKHYRDLSECILPDRFVDLHLAILNLIVSQRESVALQALQLDMILLPWTVREELHRLLKFMNAVCKDHTLKLDQQGSNGEIVLQLFSDVIFKHKVMSSNLSTLFVQFMMDNLSDIFRVPESVQDKVALKIYRLKTGDPLPILESTFCERISKEEYEKKTYEETQLAIVEIMNTILDDIKLPLKEKKQKLKQFQKFYPLLYQRHFAGLA